LGGEEVQAFAAMTGAGSGNGSDPSALRTLTSEIRKMHDSGGSLGSVSCEKGKSISLGVSHHLAQLALRVICTNVLNLFPVNLSVDVSSVSPPTATQPFIF